MKDPHYYRIIGTITLTVFEVGHPLPQWYSKFVTYRHTQTRKRHVFLLCLTADLSLALPYQRWFFFVLLSPHRQSDADTAGNTD